MTLADLLMSLDPSGNNAAPQPGRVSPTPDYAGLPSGRGPEGLPWQKRPERRPPPQPAQPQLPPMMGIRF